MIKGLPAIAFRLRAVVGRLQVTGYRLQVASCLPSYRPACHYVGLHAVDRLQVAGLPAIAFRLHAVVGRLQVTSYRLQVTGCKCSKLQAVGLQVQSLKFKVSGLRLDLSSVLKFGMGLKVRGVG